MRGFPYQAEKARRRGRYQVFYDGTGYELRDRYHDTWFAKAKATPENLAHLQRQANKHNYVALSLGHQHQVVPGVGELEDGTLTDPPADALSCRNLVNIETEQ